MKGTLNKVLRTQAIKVACLLALSAVMAQATTITATNGVSMQAPALTGFSTSGDQMDGMLVRFGFTDGTFLSAIWADTTVGAGRATIGGVTLSESGDTFSGQWDLVNHSGKVVNYLSLNGAPGETLFDRTIPSPGSNGSAQGRDFVDVSGFSTANVLYTNIFNLTTFAPVGDLYEMIIVTNFNLANGGTAIFEQDADNANAASGHVTSSVPDSGSALLLAALGLVSLGVIRRRQAA